MTDLLKKHDWMIGMNIQNTTNVTGGRSEFWTEYALLEFYEDHGHFSMDWTGHIIEEIWFQYS